MYVNDEYFDKKMKEILDEVREVRKYQKAQNGEKEVFGEGEKLMDNQDLCRMLHVSQRTLNRYRKSSSLPFFFFFKFAIIGLLNIQQSDV